ncbi:disease resistance protein RGA2-like isoform X2 [Salvia divinorum]|uniref:Disease resistance protein RGA2-like isoform X2 n=1 Tax=Salvia divinorum TaxID=28513 RepID=A0ABD1FUN8_SALDI
MESVGNMFFNVHLRNSLLRAAEADYRGRERCVMHDLVHGLASSVLSNNGDGCTLARYMFHEKELSCIPEQVSRNLHTLLLVGGTTYRFAILKILVDGNRI